MTDPFREAADSPTATALARLAAMPANPIRSALATVVWYRETRRARARPQEIASAQARGFKCLGRAAEGLVPMYRKQVFVDEPRTTQAHLSWRGYFFVTYFESGKCIITWDHIPQTPSGPMLESRATAGGFDENYDSHVAAVKKLAATDAPIVVPDLRVAIALGRFYYRGVVPMPLAMTALVSAVLPFVGLALVVYWIVAKLRVH